MKMILRGVAEGRSGMRQITWPCNRRIWSSLESGTFMSSNNHAQAVAAKLYVRLNSSSYWLWKVVNLLPRITYSDVCPCLNVWFLGYIAAHRVFGDSLNHIYSIQTDLISKSNDTSNHNSKALRLDQLPCLSRVSPLCGCLNFVRAHKSFWNRKRGALGLVGSWNHIIRHNIIRPSSWPLTL